MNGYGGDARMNRRAYSLALSVCVVVGLGLTAVIATAHARFERAAWVADAVAFDASLREGLAKATRDLAISRATAQKLQEQLDRQAQQMLVDQARAPAFERLLTLCAGTFR